MRFTVITSAACVSAYSPVLATLAFSLATPQTLGAISDNLGEQSAKCFNQRRRSVKNFAACLRDDAIIVRSFHSRHPLSEVFQEHFLDPNFSRTLVILPTPRDTAKVSVLSVRLPLHLLPMRISILPSGVLLAIAHAPFLPEGLRSRRPSQMVLGPFVASPSSQSREV